MLNLQKHTHVYWHRNQLHYRTSYPRNEELYKYAISFIVFIKVIGYIFIHTSCFEGISSYSCIRDGNRAYIVTGLCLRSSSYLNVRRSLFCSLFSIFSVQDKSNHAGIQIDERAHAISQLDFNVCENRSNNYISISPKTEGN